MEAKRQLNVLDRNLSESTYLGGNAYTIADIVVWPRYGELVRGNHYSTGELLSVQRWAELIAKRPAVMRGQRVNRTWVTNQAKWWSATRRRTWIEGEAVTFGAVAVVADERFDPHNTHWIYLAVLNEVTEEAARSVRQQGQAFGFLHDEPNLKIGLAYLERNSRCLTCSIRNLPCKTGRTISKTEV